MLQWNVEVLMLKLCYSGINVEVLMSRSVDFLTVTLWQHDPSFNKIWSHKLIIELCVFYVFLSAHLYQHCTVVPLDRNTFAALPLPLNALQRWQHFTALTVRASIPTSTFLVIEASKLKLHSTPQKHSQQKLVMKTDLTTQMEYSQVNQIIDQKIKRSTIQFRLIEELFMGIDALTGLLHTWQCRDKPPNRFAQHFTVLKLSTWQYWGKPQHYYSVVPWVLDSLCT